MEKFQESLLKARKQHKVADHMIFITYKLVKDPKLLLSALKNIKSSMVNATDSLLQYERLFKRIFAFPQNFTSKLLLLKNPCSRRYNLSQNYVFLMNELNTIIIEHERSSVEFARKDKFVICSDNYRMKTITINKIKEYLALNKAFLEDVDKIVMKKNGIFK